MKYPLKSIFHSEIFCIIILIFLFWLGFSTITPFLPLYSQKISFSPYEISLFLSVASLSRVVFQPILGIFISKKNERLIINLSFTCLLLSSAAYLFFDNFYLLTFIRIIEGAAIASFIISIRVLINRFDIKKTALINNYYSGAQNFGSFIAPSLAGFYVEKIGIKSIFWISTIIYTLANFITFKLPKVSENNKNAKEFSGSFYKSIYPYLSIIIIHSLEFIGLGLWLGGWSVYAKESLNWAFNKIGLSFSIIAISGVLVTPFLSYILKNEYRKKMIFGLILLALQSLNVVIFKNYEIILWLSFIAGGIGATMYFSSFHSLVSTIVPQKEIAIFYGFMGSFIFAGQAIGFALAPILGNISNNLPIILDAVLLLITAFLYKLFFIFFSKKAVN
ncbi:MAG: MFS transporter [Sphingobacteriia bacterium]|nr:MFS transporter [Sphingobacteriia bacterium]